MVIFSPLDRFYTACRKIRIRFRKWFGAEKTVVCGKGRRVRRFDDIVPIAINVRALCFRIISPEDEYDVFAFLVQFLYRRIRKLLPTVALVRAGFAGSHRESRIQKQYTLLRAPREIRIMVHRVPEIALKLLENILKGRRRGHTGVHRKAKPVRLPAAVVRILP